MRQLRSLYFFAIIIFFNNGHTALQLFQTVNRCNEFCLIVHFVERKIFFPNMFCVVKQKTFPFKWNLGCDRNISNSKFIYLIISANIYEGHLYLFEDKLR